MVARDNINITWLSHDVAELGAKDENMAAWIETNSTLHKLECLLQCPLWYVVLTYMNYA